jgi:hypothetical protein
MCGFGEYFGTGDSAMEILKKRYIRGDIDDVEDEERKQTARETADKILTSLKEGIPCCPPDQLSSCECASPPQAESTCCG